MENQMHDKISDLIRHATKHPYAMVLLSNKYADEYGTWNWLAGWGNQSIDLEEGKAFDILEKHLNTNDLKFMFLGYDLKNELEQLSSNNKKIHSFPAGGILIPKQWIGCNRKNKLESFGISQPEVWLEQLQEPPKGQPGNVSLKSGISQAEYVNHFEKIKSHIYDGNIYEMNFCMDFSGTWEGGDPVEWFIQKNEKFPSPFAAFVKWGHQYLLCFSPERFIRKKGPHVVAQPIKGTSPRNVDILADRESAKHLYESEKERSENVMIVDLMRNDLARSCNVGSINVSKLFEVKTYPTVHQLVSTIEGNVKSHVNAVEVIKNAFPMGSMTGCPKIRAMEIIEDEEHVKRGIYSGCIGWMNPLGDFDLNVVIRSLIFDSHSNKAAYFAGSAITSMAEAQKEYEECLLKASHFLDLEKPS